MNAIDIEKLNQIISRTDISGNDKIKWLTDFIDSREFGQQERMHSEEELKLQNRQIGAAGFVANKIMENVISKLKKETLEEAANKYASTTKPENDFEQGLSVGKALGFTEGAKWQAERMYSEAIEFADWIRIKDFQATSKNNWIGLDMKYYTTQDLFEQFKKK